jgi:hypothetical protein
LRLRLASHLSQSDLKIGRYRVENTRVEKMLVRRQELQWVIFHLPISSATKTAAVVSAAGVAPAKPPAPAHCHILLRPSPRSAPLHPHPPSPKN